MTNTNKIRLKDLVILVPSDVTLGIIKRKNGTEKHFTDISHLTEQFKCDYVTSFNISSNYFGERALIVTLEHC